jgi:hypothetical protein
VPAKEPEGGILLEGSSVAGLPHKEHSGSVHRKITERALALLKEKYPHIRLDSFEQNIIDGSEDEDRFSIIEDKWILRSFFHFFNPHEPDWRLLGVCLQAPHWATAEKGRAQGNYYTWDDALNDWRSNPHQAAYSLGHVVHLIQDMTSPDHTHLISASNGI